VYFKISVLQKNKKCIMLVALATVFLIDVTKGKQL